MSNNLSVSSPEVAQKNLSFDSQNLQANYFSLNTEKNNKLKVIRRNGSLVNYNANKIAIAMTKAFLDVEGKGAATSRRIIDTVSKLAENITNNLLNRYPLGGSVNIEEIQDQVEIALMRAREDEVAKSYILYRAERQKERDKNLNNQHNFVDTNHLNIVLESGEKINFPAQQMKAIIIDACSDLIDVDPTLVFENTVKNLFDGASLKDVYNAMLIASRPLIEKEPNYSYVAARILLHNCRNEALNFLDMRESVTSHEMQLLYPQCFKATIERGVDLKLLDKKLLDFNIEKLGKAIKTERDLLFNYLGLQTLYDRYFLHSNDTRFELPQTFFMRIAMGLAINENNKTERAIEFYNALSSFNFMSSTPTLFNSGTLYPQLSSCYLTTIDDDLAHIFKSIGDNAKLQKRAGGIGNDWTNIRAINSLIKGTNGKSQGSIPFMKIANDTALAVNQGGKRKGAVCAYLETWHLDIEEFLELRKNTGDDRRRTHDMNTANWIPDLFMKRVMENKDWTLFSPDEVSDLHDLYGEDFDTRYQEYEQMAQDGQLNCYKVISAVSLWRKMLGMVFETGHPWMTFKDPCNMRSPQQHVGVIHSSNLCTEITLNTSADEVAVCNLGSINLVNHFENGKLNLKKLQKTITTAIRMLDNVIDVNFYPIIEAENSNLQHRPIGMGIMGFQDALYIQNIPYQSVEAIEFADYCMEAISFYAIEASNKLAQEHGTYKSYAGSLWDQNILPIDSLKILHKYRGDYIDVNYESKLDWSELRENIKKYGMRNSNVLAIAPTATIANITGVTQSIEPTYQNLYVKSNLSGEFTIINPYLVKDLKALNLWDDVMINDLKYFDGSLRQIDRIPDELKEKYNTAFDIDPKWLIDAGSRRQKWIDQSQSLNLYCAQPSGKKLDDMYKYAWMKGLKTTYYLRSMGATSSEKSTVADNNLNAVKQQTEVKACSIDDPDCEACQ